MKNFVWRVCHNWVPSKSELFKRGIKMDRTCSGCWSHVETISHALWHCPWLRSFWKDAGFWHLFPKSLGLMSDLMEFLIWTPWAIDYVDHALLQPTVNKEVKKKRGVSRWMAPLVGTFLLNCDAALCTNQMDSGVAAVIRDTQRRLIVAESLFHHGCVSILLAECLAIRLGLKLVQRLNTKPFFVNSDNQTAINQLLSGKTPRADWGAVVGNFLY
ncbi:hypothetical protein G4B88_019202 [Cannabis sativa]|uniref:Reverse transcriptase zinc-binding domain-containing protein n=1 Tax=Cannabis sativa TaxID=3483 RepID=A0A7J6HMB5_CANSA|nr:hypothetical protein G4B88_019202 [Cannabis sativa]